MVSGNPRYKTLDQQYQFHPAPTDLDLRNPFSRQCLCLKCFQDMFQMNLKPLPGTMPTEFNNCMVFVIWMHHYVENQWRWCLYCNYVQWYIEHWVFFFHWTRPSITFTCSKWTIEKLEKDMNMFKYNNKNTRSTSVTYFYC